MTVRRVAGPVSIGLWCAAVIVRLHGSAMPASQSRTAVVAYEREVKPILEKRCLECHSQDKRKGGLSLATYGDALDGGKSGPVIRPGRAADSLLVHRISGEVEPQMPKDEEPLTAAEMAVVRQWIDQGARLTPTSAPAPPPWEAPLALSRPAVPAAAWSNWSSPADRFVSAYLSARRKVEPAMVADGVFARRAYLDIWGLLPTPEDLQSFTADSAPDKRRRLVTALLADESRYAEHWVSFWNDLLRNEDGVTYFSESASRKSITDWLLSALRSNMPYDTFVTRLINPSEPGDPEGFLTGVNWRGETSAAVTPWMQASQNTAQIFLGVNLKCNACHDSFVSKWKLKDAYALAAYFSPEPKLQLFRCDVARDQYAEPAFLYPELTRAPASSSLADRRAAAAAILTDPRNGRFARTLVNRIWSRLVGHGIVTNSDEMDGKPWSPELLDWLASDFVEHRYDVKHLITTIVTSRAYQMPAVRRAAEPPARDYVFAGPEVRRMTAEQFGDAVGAITGEWSVYQPRGGGGGGGAAAGRSDPLSSGAYGREWRAASNQLSRALGRPIRDQVTSVRVADATTPQALELVNGELLTRRLLRGARRMIGELPPEPLSLFNVAVGGRNVTSKTFDIDVSAARALWLLVTDTGSNAPERVEPLWAQVELVSADGSATPLARLSPRDGSGLRTTGTAASLPVTTLRVKNPSSLVYDIGGRGFTRLRGTLDIENLRSEVGSTLNPALRFFIFDTAPNMDRLVPPAPAPPFPPGPQVTTAAALVDRLFRHALGRAPTADERRLAEGALGGPGRLSAEAVADLVWAVTMKPEFQFVY
jgi:hypothetical protein